MSNEPSSIFAEVGSDIIPGEVVIQLREDTAARVTESIGRGPRRGARAVGGPTTFGVDELDAVLSGLRVSAIARLHPPAPPSSGIGTMSAGSATSPH